MRKTVLLLLLVSLLLVGCLARRPLTRFPELAPTATPEFFPTPAVILPPFLIIDMPISTYVTPTPLAVSGGSCPYSGRCLSIAPAYCDRGVIVEYCIKCGCQAGTRCARSSNLESFRCLPNYITAENYSEKLYNATPQAPQPTCRPVNQTCTPTISPKPCCTKGYDCYWNASGVVYTCQPTPTPTVTVAPVPSVYNISEMLKKYGEAYNATFTNSTYNVKFNSTVQWNEVEAGVIYNFVNVIGLYDAELWLSKGRYRGFYPDEVTVEIEAMKNHWKQTITLWETNSKEPNYLYLFRMGCFNWTYQVEAKIVERVNINATFLGREFAKRVADVCPP